MGRICTERGRVPLSVLFVIAQFMGGRGVRQELLNLDNVVANVFGEARKFAGRPHAIGHCPAHARSAASLKICQPGSAYRQSNHHQQQGTQTDHDLGPDEHARLLSAEKPIIG
jgi:hypothetical protein